MSGERFYRRGSRLTILGIAVISLFMFFLISLLRLDYNFENFLPKDDPETSFYFEFRSAFESDNDFLFFGLVNHEGIFDREFLIKYDSLVTDLESLPYLRGIFSVKDLKEFRRGLFGEPISYPLFRMDDPSMYEADSIRIFSKPLYLGSFFSADGKTLGIQVKHWEYLSKERCDTLALEVTNILDKYEFDEKHVIGRSIGQTIYVDIMKRELMVFISISLLLIAIFLIIAFRSTWGVWVPIVVVLMSIVWILGIMKLLSVDIDLMLTVLPTIIFVVGMSDVVHILSKYFEELRTGKEKLRALGIAFREIGLATFLTSLTTSVGFLTLLASSIQPIRNFGLYTAIGVFVAFLLAYSLLPAVLVLSKPPAVAFRPVSKVFWTKKLHRSFLWTIRKRKTILVSSAVAIVVFLFGISLINVDNFILEDLKESHPLKKEFRFFEQHLSGARPLEVALIIDEDTSPLSLEVLESCDKLDAFFASKFGAQSLVSPARFMKQANYFINDCDYEDFKLPEDERGIRKIREQLRKLNREDLIYAVVNEQQGLARIGGNLGDYGRKHYQELYKELDTFLSTELKDAPFEVKITGTAHLIDINNERLSTTMIQGLLIAFLVIALIAGLMFRSLRMVILALIPNILPLLAIAAVMGFTGIYLKVSTSVVFTIAFGIAVDDTIHFLSKFRIQLSKGHSKLYALKRTYISTGKAIMVTTLILCAGFFSLIFSDFLGTFYIGLLIGLTLVFAVLADLFLLPVLILLFFRNK